MNYTKLVPADTFIGRYLTYMVIKEVREDAAHIFEGTGQRTKFLLGIEALRNALVANGNDPMQRSKLYVKIRHHLDHHEFTALLDVMHEVGAIQRFAYQPAGSARTTDYVRGTKLLLTKGITEQVAEHFG